MIIVILVLTDYGNDKNIYGFANNILTDNFFFKTLGFKINSSSLTGLNGVCTERCEEGDFLPDPKVSILNEF